MKKALLLLALLVAAVNGFAQGGERIGQATQSSNGFVKTLPGAQVKVCVFNTQLTCTGLVSIYSNAALTLPQSNPFFADANGNYYYYATSGNYVEQVSSPGGTVPMTLPVTVIGASSASAAGTSGQIQYNNAGVLGGFTMSGDATINTSTGVLTLATVNSNVGTCGDSTHVAQVTLNSKGLTTACTPISVGTVTSVTSANADIAVANPTTTPVLTLNSGTSANQIVKLTSSALIPAGLVSPAFPVLSETSTYGVGTGDFIFCRVVSVPSGTFTVTLTSSGLQPAAGQCLWVVNYGGGTVTVARNGQLINGVTSSLTLTNGQGAFIVSDGTNYVAQSFGTGSGGGGDTITAPNGTLTVGGTSTNTTLDVTGAAGKILAGATPALTFTPALGVDNTSAGTLQLANGSANAHTIWGSAATTSNTILGFATAPTTGHLVDCTVSGTTCTLHDSGVVTANVVTSVTGTSPVVSSGGTTPAISISGVTAEQGNGNKLQLATGTGTQNILPKFDSNLNLINSLFTDTGSAGAYGGPFNATGAISSGTAPTGCPTAGVFCATEAASSGTPTAGTDWMRADSATHLIQVSLNGASEVPLVIAPTSTTTTLALFATATAGKGGYRAIANGDLTGVTRTYPFTFQGLCQAGVASAAINLPSSNAVAYVPCSSSAQTAEWQAGANTSVQNFWVKFPVPAGHTGTYTFSEVWRSASTTGTATITPTYACVAAGQVPDVPSYGAISGLSSITFTPAGTTLQNVYSTQTGATMTCADNADLYVLFTVNDTSLGSGAGTLNFSRIQISVQGSI